MIEYTKEFIQWFDAWYPESGFTMPLLRETFKEVAFGAWLSGRLDALQEDLKESGLTKKK